jgi:hypothetical protein
MVSYWIVVFTGLRAAVMDYVLMPFAKNGGVKTPRDQTRFAEQAWLLIYYSVFWTIGMVCTSSGLETYSDSEPSIFLRAPTTGSI